MDNQVKKEKSRGAYALVGTTAGFIRQFISLVCGLILPRLILSAFGSTYNGLTSSITQFLSVITLMRAGIGGASRAALYKPLAEKDSSSVSMIMNQMQKYMQKLTCIFFAFILVFAALYSYFLRTDFDFWFTFSLVFVIASSVIAQNYLGFPRQMLLEADQKVYVTSSIYSICTILNTLAYVLLIVAFNVKSIHIVMLGSVLAFVVAPVFLYYYTQKRYSIDKKIVSKEDMIPQKWDALGLEVANFINNNTDVIVLTVFTDLKTVSVYSVYHYVVSSIRAVLVNFISSFEAAFGNMYAKKQYELMEQNFKIFELITFSLISIIYSSVFVLLTPFVKIYTSGITDTNYNRLLFGIVLTAAGIMSCTKIPYESIIRAVGHYKQTRNASFIEAGINITVSVICVFRFGLVGVAVGTLIAMTYRSILYAVYLSKNIIKRSIFYYVKHMLIMFAVSGITYALSLLYLKETTSIFQWIFYAVITVLIAGSLTLATDFVFYKDDSQRFINKIQALIKYRRPKKEGDSIK